jgi:ATP-dependent Clp protease ATP-binding subunit ClpC
LHRAIQKYLEDPLAEEILNMNVKNGDILLDSLVKENSKIVFEIIGCMIEKKPSEV